MKKVIVNGADRNNKQMRRTILVGHCDEKEICEKAFAVGFSYVRSYRHNDITTKIF